MPCSLAIASVIISLAHGSLITSSLSSPAKAAGAPLEAFISYSIEFSSFPDFAGNTSSPNIFSNNLLNNIASLQGTKPYIRVGGNTQDYALYDAALASATKGTVVPARSPDYPTILTIGPTFFESYSTWPDTKYSHGFNLALGANESAGWETLLATVPLACKALGGGKLLMWEYGNEPDLYSTSAQGATRPADWNADAYVAQWLNGTRSIKAALAKACPDLLGDEYGYMAPSFAGVNNHLLPIPTWNSGLDADKDIKLFSSHNYIGGATQPGITLAHTLLNHTATVHSISQQLPIASFLSNTSIPFILGETNSLYNQGASGLSNSFGAALWALDFSLYCASSAIRRIHMHQGTNYRYQSWQPVSTALVSRGTKAPYYGNVAAAAFLGDLRGGDVTVVNVAVEQEDEAAYASLKRGKLRRLVLINMREYNYTVAGLGGTVSGMERPTREYTIEVDGQRYEEIGIKRLLANGSDAVTGVTWDGWSYNWELDEGKPVRLGNVTVGEKVRVVDGVVKVNVPDSSAAVLEFESSAGGWIW